MIELTPRDFRPLDGFPLSRRWIGSAKELLPIETLTHIHPLREAKASELWLPGDDRYIDELWQCAFKDIPEPLPSTSLFEFILRIDVNQDGVSVVTKKLRSLSLPDDEIVVVQWEQEIAVTVPWGILRENWYNFCYPGSDDVSMCPVTETWLLLYYHEDQIIFGRPHLPMLDEASRKRPAASIKPFIHRDDVLLLIRNNEKIAAIKLYHQETGSSLKEAMNVVNRLAAELQQSTDER